MLRTKIPTPERHYIRSMIHGTCSFTIPPRLVSVKKTYGENIFLKFVRFESNIVCCDKRLVIEKVTIRLFKLDMSRILLKERGAFGNADTREEAAQLPDKQ